MAKARKGRNLKSNTKQTAKTTYQKRTPIDYEKERQASQKMDRREYEKMLAKQSMAKRNQKRRKTRKSFISIFLVIIALIVCAFVCALVFFKIDNINFNIPEDMNKEDILAVCTFVKEENLIKADTQSSVKKIYDKFKDVDSVIIEKKYPSTVNITIKKAQADFVIKNNDNSDFYLISTNGRVIKKATSLSGLGEDNQDKIIVSGFSGTFEEGAFINKDDEKFENYKIIIDGFNTGEITGIKQINLSDNYNLNVLLNNKIKISLGSISSIEYKIKMAKSAIEKDFSNDDYGVIDVSKEGSAYVRKGRDYIASFYHPADDNISKTVNSDDSVDQISSEQSSNEG